MDTIKVNDCFIQRYLEASTIYKIKQFKDDKYTVVDKIFVAPNKYSYNEYYQLSVYDERFKELDKFPVEIFDKMMDEIVKEKHILHKRENEMIGRLFNYVNH